MMEIRRPDICARRHARHQPTRLGHHDVHRTCSERLEPDAFKPQLRAVFRDHFRAQRITREDRPFAPDRRLRHLRYRAQRFVHMRALTARRRVAAPDRSQHQHSPAPTHRHRTHCTHAYAALALLPFALTRRPPPDDPPPKLLDDPPETTMTNPSWNRRPSPSRRRSVAAALPAFVAKRVAPRVAVAHADTRESPCRSRAATASPTPRRVANPNAINSGMPPNNDAKQQRESCFGAQAEADHREADRHEQSHERDDDPHWNIVRADCAR